MRLLMQDPNPLNVLGIRELNYMPKNFECITLKNEGWMIQSVVENARQWIYNNLEGRFCIVTNLKTINNKMEVVYQIGFEEPGESTIFSLGCSVLHNQNIQLV